MAAAIGPIIGGLLGAGGNIAGGLLGGASGGQGKTSYYNPYLDYALQASQFDALNGIGFGNINNVPDPWQQLIGKLQSTAMDDKTRRRAMAALNNVRQDPTLLSDPYGTNFTQEQVLEAQRTGQVPFGRTVQFIPNDIRTLVDQRGGVPPNGLPILNVGRLSTALQAAGLSLDDLNGVLQQEADQKAQRERFKAAGLDKLNEQTIINRARANATANDLIGGAAAFAGGGPLNETGNALLARDNRQLHDLEQQLGLASNFGGMNWGQAVKQLTNAHLDQQLRLIEQQLGMSTSIQAALNPGQTAASQSAAASSSTSMNAAQIAAAQAQAANQLRAQQAQNASGSLANGIGNAFAGLGQTISNQSLLNQLNKNYTSGFNTGGPGSTANQLETLRSMGYQF